MNNKIYDTLFLEAVKNKISHRATLTNRLVELLNIDKVAVYRRLRGEVPFSFREISLLSQELGISLDALITHSTNDTSTQNLLLIENLHDQTDVSLLGEFANMLKKVSADGHSEGGELTNILPLPVYMKYDTLGRFYIFKWKYQALTPGTTPIKLQDVIITDKIREAALFNLEVARSINLTHYIFDPSLFNYLINDIQYCHSIGLISRQEVKQLKEELLHVTEDIEELCETGIFKGTMNKVNVYISSVNFDTSYLYIQNEKLYLALIKVFILNGVVAKDRGTFEKIKEWVLSLKRHSTLISESGEKERIVYLNRQRELIQTL